MDMDMGMDGGAPRIHTCRQLEMEPLLGQRIRIRIRIHTHTHTQLLRAPPAGAPGPSSLGAAANILSPTLPSLKRAPQKPRLGAGVGPLGGVSLVDGEGHD